MSRKRKPIDALRSSGTWRHMSRKQKRKHIRALGYQVLEPGRPQVPEGLEETVMQYFSCVCHVLEKEQSLATTDGFLILAYIRLANSGAWEAASKLMTCSGLASRFRYPPLLPEKSAGQRPESRSTLRTPQEPREHHI